VPDTLSVEALAAAILRLSAEGRARLVALILSLGADEVAAVWPALVEQLGTEDITLHLRPARFDPAPCVRRGD
jgi:hypothetical protein